MMRIRTSSVHAGVDKDATYNSVITPIYPTSTFRFDAIGKTRGYDYSRSGNPTRSAVEESIAALEGGSGCSVTATGMAAVTAIMFLFKPEDHIITGDDIYGGTYRLFRFVLEPMGYQFSFINLREIKQVVSVIRKNTKMIWIETPSNPLLNIVDIKAVALEAKKRKILTVVDNTFLSPYFQRPLELGADLVMHSTTKYINGHSDVVGGAVIYGKSVELQERVRHLINCLGVAQAPFDSWFVLRGIKTLPYRMEAHQKNALALAKFLQTQPYVKKVYYPGLDTHPQRALIKKQMLGFGGMLSFELDIQKRPLARFFKKLKLFSLAESLGGVESLIEQPWSMSHASMGKDALLKSGISRSLIRVSVGIEDFEDLKADMNKALNA